MDNTTESQIAMSDYPVRVAILVVMTVLVYVGNIIVMVVLSTTSTIPYHQKYLMCSLCCTDLSMAGLLTLSLMTSSHDRWIFGFKMCKITSLLAHVCVDVTYLTLAAMVLDKFLIVRYPMKHDRLATKKVVVMCVISIWLYSILFLTFQHHYWQYAYLYADNVFICVIGVERAEDAAVTALFRLSISWLPSILTSVVCNIKIYLISSHHHNRIRDFTQGGSAARVNVKGLRTIMIASGFSVMSSAPNLFYFLLTLVVSMPQPGPTAGFFLYYIVISNSFTNFIIYSTTHSGYQKAQRKVLKRIKIFCAQMRYRNK